MDSIWLRIWLDPGLDRVLFAGAVDDGRRVLVDHDALGAAEVVEGGVLEPVAALFRDDRAARERRDVFEHGLAAVAEAGGLDGGHAERAAELVHDERGEGLAVDVFGDDEQRGAHLRDLLQDGEEVLHRGDLLVMDEDHDVFERDLHVVGVRHEVRREVAAVELHALDGVERGLGALGLLDRDDAVLADLVHRVGDEVADLGVVVGRDGADLGDLVLALDVAAEGLELGHDRLHGGVDAALEVHRVRAGGDVAEARRS